MTESSVLSRAIEEIKHIESYLGTVEGGELWDACRFVRETLESLSSPGREKCRHEWIAIRGDWCRRCGTINNAQWPAVPSTRSESDGGETEKLEEFLRSDYSHLMLQEKLLSLARRLELYITEHNRQWERAEELQRLLRDVLTCAGNGEIGWTELERKIERAIAAAPGAEEVK